MKQHRWRVVVDRALVVTGIAFFLVWTAHGDLTRAVPGGQATALGLLAAIAVLLALAILALGGYRNQARAWLVAARAPSVLVLLCAVAMLPRVITAVGAPSYPELEQQALAEAHRMLTTGDFRPTTFARPSALLYAQTAISSAFFLAGVSVDRWREVKAVQPADLAQVARLLNLGLALATVVLLSALGGRHQAKVGYFAALLFAVSPLAWTATSSATEDALATLAALAVWWGITRLAALAETPSARLLSLVRAGFLLGLAASIRPSLILLAIPLVLMLARRPARPLWHWGILVVSVATGFTIAVPYTLAALPTLLDAGGAALRQYSLRADQSSIADFGGQLLPAAGVVVRRDGLLALTAGLGLLSWFAARLATASRRPWEQLPHAGLLLSYLLPAGMLFALQTEPSARLLLPLEPFLALLGGQFLASSWDALRGSRGPRRRRTRR